MRCAQDSETHVLQIEEFVFERAHDGVNRLSALALLVQCKLKKHKVPESIRPIKRSNSQQNEQRIKHSGGITFSSSANRWLTSPNARSRSLASKPPPPLEAVGEPVVRASESRQLVFTSSIRAPKVGELSPRGVLGRLPAAVPGANSICACCFDTSLRPSSTVRCQSAAWLRVARHT